MAKKKTRVLLPGGMQGLVHDLQNGTSNFAPRPITIDDTDEDETVAAEPAAAVSTEEPQQAAATTAQYAKEQEVTTAREPRLQVQEQPKEAPRETPAPMQSATNREDMRQANEVALEVPPVEVEPVPTVSDGDTQAANGRGRRPKENTMREYHIVQDNSKDSWDLFIDMAQQYKNGGGKLSTIYIDESLKSVLDRLKYAGPDKLSTSAILSSIVARFIYDHEEDIKKALFSGNLL
ncbi:MAG: hypothetical protein KA067_02205 [Prevotella sp.]|nr:hypothetical protein [Prevotella sp.]